LRHADVWEWTATRERPLPWRGERDPYRILVSEVMLQQTQAARVAPHYERFIARFPDIAALAGAQPGDVLLEWSNLGYPRRALNLWKAAQAIVERGSFPQRIEGLEELPGVGTYTARAIASFAFDVDVAAVDANVRRVVARFHGADGGVQELADSLVPRAQAAAWNQAMIDLGAEVCTARAPRCECCPIRDGCAWRRGIRPAATVRRKAPRFEETARFARGRVMHALRGGSFALTRLRTVTGLEDARLRAALDDLVADGLVHRRAGRFALGPQSRPT
jgi:A/G-specific adenine glycosylase